MGGWKDWACGSEEREGKIKGRRLRFWACIAEWKMIRTLSEEMYREMLSDFMINRVLDWPIGDGKAKAGAEEREG